MARVLCILALSCLAACSVEVPDGRFACQVDDECPAEFGCGGEGRCRRDVMRLPVDASTDVSPDSPDAVGVDGGVAVTDTGPDI